MTENEKDLNDRLSKIEADKVKELKPKETENTIMRKPMRKISLNILKI